MHVCNEQSQFLSTQCGAFCELQIQYNLSKVNGKYAPITFVFVCAFASVCMCSYANLCANVASCVSVMVVFMEGCCNGTK